jgi:hypothetical protein
MLDCSIAAPPYGAQQHLPPRAAIRERVPQGALLLQNGVHFGETCPA